MLQDKNSNYHTGLAVFPVSTLLHDARFLAQPLSPVLTGRLIAQYSGGLLQFKNPTPLSVVLRSQRTFQRYSFGCKIDLGKV